ncbi:MAG: hypothetical protein KJ888_20495 [Gammaproteobacteria bacterium]|uniref:Uncharacterized protein n=1 Tax=viral metagenome TaxID=1070528 RepID=A0A6M3IN30_9ZZZZ|nr:hypothetical protein [Gammaproteobacteria bacterium]MBU2346577.1 hypothetical protein [Gammaproteobacteria bacterium]
MNEEWREEVLDKVGRYFLEYVSVDELYDAWHEIVDVRKLSNYQDIMQEIRRILRDKYDKKEIPFIANYRRN